MTWRFQFPERTFLLAILAACLSLWIFIEVADEVREGESHAYDEAILRSLRQPADPSVPVGPTWLREASRDITALGGGTVVTLVTLAVLGFLLLRQKFALMLVVLAAIAGGGLLSSVLKGFFGRERPAHIPHLMEATSPSFPSGHSMLAAIVYLTLGAMLGRITQRRREKYYFLIVAVVIVILVGLSRMYLGVHFPTDVLAGWSAGIVWAVFCASVARWLQQKGQVEPPDAA
ncbi:phosphatase PAP2 family protein [Verrucomicrobium sp. BvORR106]|uniref:phosphatase PAP2 family protein n=1 Tax=Verrucomicrobium sp. BvORR106 TaxID=1403819 RepID=UPI00068BA1A0|nr:phosphatase PAP2 family protein [Verrucomicrobium sp. BvORR106]